MPTLISIEKTAPTISTRSADAVAKVVEGQKCDTIAACRIGVGSVSTWDAGS